MLTKKKLFMFTFLMVVGIGFSACETMHGAGRDIEKAGESVQSAAE
jgi:predicted small secreted protein